MAKNDSYYLAFSHCFGIGPMKFTALLKRFGSVKKAYESSEKDLLSTIGNYAASQFKQFRNSFNPIKKIEEFRKKQILVLTREDKQFPESLLQIPDPPICLYVKGDIANFNFLQDNLIGVVGTRKPTSYGIQIAQKFVFELANAGFIVVSGLALGIDSIAHRVTLDAEGKTIAVLGCGVDIIYPQSNTSLYRQIIAKGGLIISEFPPGHLVLKGLFISRNRLISGLSKGVLVIEGASDSGALITARFAAEQGKEVFAPPGPLTSQMSEAPNLLLKQGAKLVTSIDDILDEFNLKIIPKKKAAARLRLSEQEKIIFDVLIKEPAAADELSAGSKIPIDAILTLLSSLEIRGIVEKNSEGKYQIKI